MTAFPLAPARRPGGRLLAVLSLAAVLAATAFAAAPALADGPAVIVKVHPANGAVSPYFSLSAKPGATAPAGSLELVNPTARPVTVRLDPVDAVTASTLGSAYTLTSAALDGAARWLTLSARRVSIPAHGRASVGVGVAVPKGAPGGDDLAGVSVEALGQDSVAKSHGLAIGQVERYAIGVEVSLPGPRHPLVSFTGAAVRRDPSGTVFDVLARNAGNVILQGVSGRVVVTQGRRRVAATTISPGTFVTGTAIAYPVRAPREQPREGARYLVTAVMRYPGGVARMSRVVVFGHAAAVAQAAYGGPPVSRPGVGIPWELIAGALGLLGAGLAAAVLRWRGRPRGREQALATLARELVACSPERPLSAVLVRVANATPGRRRQVAEALATRLRPSDAIFDLGSEGLALVMPDAGAALAEALAADTATVLAREGLADALGGVHAATVTRPVEPHELLAGRAPAPAEALVPA